MNFTFETQGNNTFLVYTIQEKDVVDTLALGMITNNKIPGIASVLYSQLNNDQFLKYNVTAKVTVKQFFSGMVNRRRLLGVFSSVASALTLAEEYMISTGSLLLDVEHIYVDVSTCGADIICLPLMKEGQELEDPSMFFKNIMFSTQFDQTENCDYVAKIINYLNSTPMFVAEDFNNLLKGLQDAPKAADPVLKAPSSLKPLPEAQKKAEDRRPAPQSAPAPRVQPAPQVVPPQPQPQAPRAQQAPMRPPVQQAPAPQTPPRRETYVQPQAAGEQDKEMSLFYLLQHYNKDNVAAYKAQKDSKKGAGSAKGSGKQAPAPSAGFAIPGQPTPAAGAGFAIPGQQTPIQPQPAQPQPAKPAPQPAAKPSAKPAPSPVNPAAPAWQAQVQQELQQPKVVKVPPMEERPASPQQRPASDYFGETVCMPQGSASENTVVMEFAMTKPYLLRLKNNEKITLDKPILRMGKERSYVDYCISDNSTVSRSHADIINRDGQYYIKDNNSTNHTFVNGEMIPSNQEIALDHGAKIILSNEEFEFRTY